MKIQVTREDIKNGVRLSYNQCPIALAISRNTKCPVFVGERFVFLGEKDSLIASVRGDLPYIARNFIFSFDLNEEVTPFEFEIDMYKL